MLESRQCVDGRWPMDRIFGSSSSMSRNDNTNDWRFWLVNSESALTEQMSDYSSSNYKVGDEVMGRDALGRWLMALIVGVVVQPPPTQSRYQPQQQRVSREVAVASVELRLQFNYAGCVWEEVVLATSNPRLIRRVLPLNGSNCSPSQASTVVKAGAGSIVSSGIFSNSSNNNEVKAVTNDTRLVLTELLRSFVIDSYSKKMMAYGGTNSKSIPPLVSLLCTDPYSLSTTASQNASPMSAAASAMADMLFSYPQPSSNNKSVVLSQPDSCTYDGDVNNNEDDIDMIADSYNSLYNARTQQIKLLSLLSLGSGAIMRPDYDDLLLPWSLSPTDGVTRQHQQYNLQIAPTATATASTATHTPTATAGTSSSALLGLIMAPFTNSSPRDNNGSNNDSATTSPSATGLTTAATTTSSSSKSNFPQSHSHPVYPSSSLSTKGKPTTVQMPITNSSSNMIIPHTMGVYAPLVQYEPVSPGGVAGLNNLGNTCYMSSALHCLSHTPLLASFFLSGKYKRDLNRSNVLGTGGKLTEDFAALLHMLWNVPLKSNGASGGSSGGSNSTSNSTIGSSFLGTNNMNNNSNNSNNSIATTYFKAFKSLVLSPSAASAVHTQLMLAGGNSSGYLSMMTSASAASTTRVVSAMEFKRTLQKCKSQFSGHDQQDAQEFLAELLDALHEDLNRFDRAREASRDKRRQHQQVHQQHGQSQLMSKHQTESQKIERDAVHVDSTSPLTAITAMTTANSTSSSSSSAQSSPRGAGSNHAKREQGQQAMSRHLSRNKSVVMDLFLGQQCSEVTCRDCGHSSLTFDPFLSLSLPLPREHHEATVCVIVIRKMPRVRFTHSSQSASTPSLTSTQEQRLIDLHASLRCPVRLVVSLPRLADIKDLKKAVCTLLLNPQSQEAAEWRKLQLPSLSPEHVTTAELISTTLSFEGSNNIIRNSPNGMNTNASPRVYSLQEISRILDDAEPLASLLEASEAALAAQSQRSQGGGNNSGSSTYTVLLMENTKDLAFVTALKGERLDDRLARLPVDDSTEDTNAIALSSSSSSAMSTYYDEDVEYNYPDEQLTGDVVVDIDELWRSSGSNGNVHGNSNKERLKQWPKVITGITLGTRLDAVDHRGQWFAGTALEWWQVDAADLELLAANSSQQSDGSTSHRSNMSTNSTTTLVGMPRQLGLHLRVHFDNFSHKWDEWFGAKDFAAGRLAPVYSNAPRKLKVLDIQVVHKRTFKTQPASSATTNQHADNNHTTDATHSLSSARSTGSQRSTGGKSQSQPQNTTHSELAGLPFTLQCESFRSCAHFYSHAVEQAMRYAAPSEWQCFLTSLAEARQKVISNGTNSRNSNDTKAEEFEWPFDMLPFTIRLCSMGNALAVTPSVTDEKQAKVRKAHAVWEGMEFPQEFARNRPLSNIFHSKLLLVIDWRSLSDTSASSAMGRGFPSRARFIDLPFIDHDSYTTRMQMLQLQHEKNVSNNNSSTMSQETARDRRNIQQQSSAGAVTLQECLRVYAGVEEQLEDNSWHCEVCCRASRATVQTSLSRVPEVLVMHLKRFGMTARWREKIRTRVLFPLTALDMSPYLAETLRSNAEPGSHRLEDQRERDEYLYDLYAVVNHLGGMSGGHYTAFIKCSTADPSKSSLPYSMTTTIPDYYHSLTATATSLNVTGWGASDNVFLDTQYSSGCNSVPLDASRYTQYIGGAEASDGGDWYLFDDDVVSQVAALEVENQIVSETAYMLFYRRRQLQPSTHTNLSP